MPRFHLEIDVDDWLFAGQRLIVSTLDEQTIDNVENSISYESEEQQLGAGLLHGQIRNLSGVLSNQREHHRVCTRAC